MQKSKEKRILIIDDHPLVKDGIENRIKAIFEDVIITFTNDYLEGINYGKTEIFDLVITDLSFDNANNKEGLRGYDLAKELLDAKPNLNLIVLTSINLYNTLNKMYNLNIKAYLTKSCSFEDFEKAVTAAINGIRYKSEDEKLIRSKRNKGINKMYKNQKVLLYTLSFEETKYLSFLNETRDRKELAKNLFKSESAVDKTRKKTMNKLDIKYSEDLLLFSKLFNEEINHILANYFNT